VISENSIDMNAARRRLGKLTSIEYLSFTKAAILGLDKAIRVARLFYSQVL
jgi:hypothetical protein